MPFSLTVIGRLNAIVYSHMLPRVKRALQRARQPSWIPHRYTPASLYASTVLRWCYMRLPRVAVDGDFEGYIPVLGATIYATRRCGIPWR